MFIILFSVFFFCACSMHDIPEGADGVGGGQDNVTINLPFALGYTSQCVQGAGGSYSHTYKSTRYDVDFDTPNNSDDPVYAPIAGVAYVRDRSPRTGFGIHINIDLGDGSYIVLGHLSQILVKNGDEVTAGQLIGVEGTTGSSTGDHVHVGRHTGKAASDATAGASIQGLTISAFDDSVGVQVEKSTSQMTCGISDGHKYESTLPVISWHQDGSLVKSYSGSEVYLLENGEKRHFSSESVFWSYNYDFDDVAIVSDEELDCYSTGSRISKKTSVQAVLESGEPWLIVGNSSSEEFYSVRIGDVEPEAVLASWGISVSDVNDLPDDSGLLDSATCRSGELEFRDGALIKEKKSSAVYLISGGVAMPIADWNTYLLLGFLNREIITIGDGTLVKVQSSVGDCSSDLLCLNLTDVQTCGGPDNIEGVGGSGDGSVDADGDGWTIEEGDCDDGWYGTYPGAEEWCTDGADNDCDGAVDEGCGDTGEIPDDLNEGLSWIHVDGDSLGLTVSDVFSSSVNGNDVAVTGYGFPVGWGYSSAYLTDYDSDTDIAWYNLSDGLYRLTMRTQSQWADLASVCADSSTRSDLCYLNSDNTYSLCLEAHYDEIWALSSSECRELE